MPRKLMSLTTILLLLSVTLFVATTTLTAAPPDAPVFAETGVPPIVPTSTPEPPQPMDRSTWPAPPDIMSPAMQAAQAQQAIQLALGKYQRYWGPRYKLSPVQVTVRGDWARGISEAQDINYRGINAPLNILAHRLPDGTWLALLPGDEVYGRWLNAAPESLVSVGEKRVLKEQVAFIERAAFQSSPSTLSSSPLSIDVDFSGQGPISADIQQGIINILTSEAKLFTERTFFMLSSYRVYQNSWVEAYIVAPITRYPKTLQGLPGNFLILKKTPDGWIGHIESHPRYNTLLKQAPISFIEPLPLLRSGTTVDYKFPWTIGQTWYLTSHLGHGAGWTLPAGNSMDFGPASTRPSDRAVLASAAGRLHTSCNKTNDSTQVALLIVHQDGTKTEYLHINKSTARLDLVGKDIVQGQYLGDIYWGSISTLCGNTGGPHLHFGISNLNILIEGVKADSIGKSSLQSSFLSHNPRVDNSSSCSAPSLTDPGNGATLNSKNITFRWNVSSGCTPNGYTLRVKNTTNMESGGTTYLDTGVGGTSYNCTFDGNSSCQNAPENTDLYWSVRPIINNQPAGNWSSARRFRIDTSPPPASGNWHAKYVEGSTCWWDTNCANWNSPKHTETISGPTLDKNWGPNSPGGGVSPDNWVGNFEATINFSPGEYVFNLDHDDGVRLWLNGQSIEDSGGSANNPVCNGTGGYILNGNENLRVLLREEGGDAKVHLTWSTDTSLCQPPAPNPPTLQSPADGASFNEGDNITLSWSATGNDYYGEISGGPNPLTFGWQSGTSKNIGSQWAGYTYSWRVKARNGSGESGWSSVRTFTVKPAAPTNLNAQAASCTQINLTWKDNSNNETGYKIYRAGAYIGQVGSNVTSYQDSGLSGNTAYSYYVKAYRNSIESNAGNTVNISTPVCITGPDLTPSQWGGWQYPVVPASITGTNVVNTLYAGFPTYIDWGLTNAGDINTGGNTWGDLYLDDTRLSHYDFGNVTPGQQWAFIDWMKVITTPGWHTLKVVVDPDDFIAESDETNNSWQRDFYWMPTAPFSDNMENGLNNWTATGLWHQVDSSSSYFVSSSGTHSWWYGQEATGNYDTGAGNSGELTSPSIYIPATGYYLRFWYRYETETQSPDWDQRLLQISVDGGPFSNVLQLYDDPTNRWLKSQVINLSGYAGHTIRVRFYFDTLDAGHNAYRGWYIDDFDISTTPPPPCADTHEPNNTPAQATTIAYDQTLSADICAGGDYDYYRFTGATGDKVVVDIDAMSNGSWLDSYIYLLDSDGLNVLSANDDEVFGQVRDSHLGYTLPTTGTYYIKVKAWDHPSAGGSNYFYTINLITDTAKPASAQITLPANNGWLNSITQTVIVNATDNESGIKQVRFWWHDADWQNSDWVWLGADSDGRDGWHWNFDTSGLTEQQGSAFYIRAFDWANNSAGAGVWDLGIDHTPPTTTLTIQPMYGDAPFRDFWVNWRDSTDIRSGIANYDIQYRDGTNGTWTDMLTHTTRSFTRFIGIDGHSYYFRARARDTVGNESLYNAEPDIAQYSVQIDPIPADTYETDNSYFTANTIKTDGTWQTRNFHATADQDWVKFSGTTGFTYTLVTTNTGGHADTVIYLYGNDGTTLIASNDDDANNWPASRLVWVATANSTYYVKVVHWDPYGYGASTIYGLSISSETPFINHIFLPIIFK